jgi:hypothetical protein
LRRLSEEVKSRGLTADEVARIEEVRKETAQLQAARAYGLKEKKK